MDYKTVVTPRGSTVIAFATGILVTLVFTNSVARQLRKERFQPHLQEYETPNVEPQSGETSQILLEYRGTGFGEGIESTIGNTPLIKIKSLSEETGCEILAKAEVRLQNEATDCPR
jgi:cysteine synthase A